MRLSGVLGVSIVPKLARLPGKSHLKFLAWCHVVVVACLPTVIILVKVPRHTENLLSLFFCVWCIKSLCHVTGAMRDKQEYV